MRIRRLAASGCAIAALSFVVAACGEDEGGGGGEGGANELTIYSSLPLQGTSRGQSLAVINGEKLALEDVKSKIGNIKLKYVSLDDSTAQNPGTADEGQTAQNARAAVRDQSTILYLGEFNSGGTKVSLPILNKAGIPQISPSNTYGGLTTDEPGAEPGEPDKYYPTGKRTYARIVPRDKIQGAALVSTMLADGCQTTTLWDDKTTYGAGLARNIEQAAQAEGLTIENRQGTDRNSPNYRSIASQINSDCFVFAGVTGENGVQVYKDVAAAAPDAKLYGPDGVAEAAFTNPEEGGIPADVGARTKLTVATLGVEELPQAGRYHRPLQEEVQDEHGRPVRHLRLRDHGARARRAEARPVEARRRHQGGPPGRRGRDLRDEGPRERHRDLLDRRERRHDADGLRPVRDRGRPARVRLQDRVGRRSSSGPSSRGRARPDDFRTSPPPFGVGSR